MAETKEKSTGSDNGGANKNAGEKSKLFREKNLERLESPEQLNDYLRVTSPGVWSRRSSSMTICGLLRPECG